MSAKAILGASLAAVVVVSTSGVIQADVFNMPSGLTSLEMVRVGDAGNTPDTRIMNDGTSGYGSVGYTYFMGRCEVTNAQYTQFLNAVAFLGDPHDLYYEGMGQEHGGIERTGSGTEADPYVYSANDGDHAWDNRPVGFVSFFDAARFVNWLSHGQPHGPQGNDTTEDGTYFLGGVTDPDNLSVVRKSNAWIVVPNEDEWYKAAYYKGDGLDAGYWQFATQSDVRPSHEPPPGTDLIKGSANLGYAAGPPYYTTEVGAYTAKPSCSAYGAFDQDGNVIEWIETIGKDDLARGFRGGGYTSTNDAAGAGFHTGRAAGDSFRETVGFRVASIPEPGELALLAGLTGMGLLCATRKRPT
jgi:formylglycine-generating enzyme